MALGVFQKFIVDDQGNIQQGASVEVRNQSGGLIQIYSDEGGTTPLANPFLTDSTGLARFYCDPQQIRVEATKGALSVLWVDHWVNDSMSAQDAADFPTTSYVDAGDAATLVSANAYTDSEIAALNLGQYATITYVDNQDAATLASANSYTDTQLANYGELGGANNWTSTNEYSIRPTVGGDAVAITTDLDALSDGLELYVNRYIGAGVISGCEITIASPTTIDISAGELHVFDGTNIIDVPFAGVTGLTVPDIATQDLSYVRVDATGSVVFTGTADFGAIDMTAPFIGSVAHQNRTSLTAVSNASRALALYLTQSLNMVNEVLGTRPSEDDDFAFSAFSNNLQLQRASGTALRMGINKANSLSPNRLAASAASPVASFVTAYRDGAGGFTVGTATAVTGDQWDDGSGTLQTVPNNRWTVARLYYSPEASTVTEQTIYHYGQNLYNTLAEAEQSLATEQFDASGVPRGYMQRSYLIFRGGTTDLSGADAQFLTVSKNGAAVGGASGGGITSLQDTYEASTQPQITTDATRGALVVQDGTGNNLNPILQTNNNAGQTAAYIDGFGNFWTVSGLFRSFDSQGVAVDALGVSGDNTEIGISNEAGAKLSFTNNNGTTEIASIANTGKITSTLQSANNNDLLFELIDRFGNTVTTIKGTGETTIKGNTFINSDNASVLVQNSDIDGSVGGPYQASYVVNANGDYDIGLRDENGGSPIFRTLLSWRDATNTITWGEDTAQNKFIGTSFLYDVGVGSGIELNNGTDTRALLWNSAGDNAYLSLVDSANNTGVYLNSGGNSWIDGGLGIGTDAPTAGYKLDTIGSIRAETAPNTTVSGFLADNTLGQANIYHGAGNNWVIDLDDSSDTVKTRIHSNGKSFFNGGNVGIGTDTPNAPLDVNGEVVAQELSLLSSSLVNFAPDQVNGGLNITTSNPTWMYLNGNRVLTTADSVGSTAIAEIRRSTQLAITQSLTSTNVWQTADDSTSGLYQTDYENQPARLNGTAIGRQINFFETITGYFEVSVTFETDATLTEHDFGISYDGITAPLDANTMTYVPSNSFQKKTFSFTTEVQTVPSGTDAMLMFRTVGTGANVSFYRLRIKFIEV